MDAHLLIHNIGYGASTIATLIGFLFLILNNPRAKGHIPLALTFLAVTVFISSHILGANAVNPETSRMFFMFNLSIFFIGAFNVHAVFSTLGKSKDKWYIIIFIYALAIIFSIFFIIYPDFFLHASVPKMYFPNYYVPGALNWIRMVFLYGSCTFFIFELFKSYKKDANFDRKRQLKYLIISYTFAYALGFIPNFLVYDIPVDPLWGMMFMVTFTVIFLYAAIKYELMNIKIIAKQALVYGIVVASVGSVIVLFEFLSRTIGVEYPSFPAWIIPTSSVVLVALITSLVWKKIREVDLLKYEFITTVTHKFRTPLTQIRWASDNLVNSVNLSKDDKDQIRYIKSANSNLVDLTSLLVTVSGDESSTYEYRMEKINLKTTIEEIIVSIETSIANKKITIKNNFATDVYAQCDSSRIKFVIQTFIENAISYTPEGGIVDIFLCKKDAKVIVSVKDSGIGILKNEFPLIFSKFYRSSSARINDTEGLGIGLFISKQIITRHEGKIWVESEGVNRGSTFSFSIPALN